MLTSISSNAATVIAVTLLYPLEIVKTRSQIQVSKLVFREQTLIEIAFLAWNEYDIV